VRAGAGVGKRTTKVKMGEKVCGAKKSGSVEGKAARIAA
jgi:hypothetical protein